MKPSRPDIKVNSKEEVDLAINSFKNLVSQEKLTDLQVKESFFELFGSFLLLYQHYEKAFLKAFPIYRARPVKQVKDKNNWKCYGAPPKNQDCGIGRANLRCKNVFYGSSNPLGALLETRQANNGEEFYLGRWVFKSEDYKDSKIAVSSFVNPTLNGDGLWDVLIPDMKKSHDFFVKIYGVEKAEVVQYLFLELGKLFSIKEEGYYQITAFLADQIIYNSNENDARFPSFLLYPSVINGNALNIAIHPDFVDKFFHLEKVVKITIIDKVDNGTIKVLPELFGLIEDDALRFYERSILLNGRQFLIDKLQCGCGIEIEFDDPEKLILKNKQDYSNVSLKEVCYQILVQSFSHPDYEDVLNESFGKDGMVSGINQSMSIKIENYELDYAGENHDVFIADCNIIQPFQYERVE